MMYTAAVAVIALLWISGSVSVIKKYMRIGLLLVGAGLLLLAVFLSYLWVTAGRPPMRSIGETRLWYSLFLPLIGMALYRFLRNRWVLVYGVGVALVFLLINVMKPQNFDAALMPALQSPFFIPHVLVYIFGYALLAGAAIAAMIFLKNGDSTAMRSIDTVVVLAVVMLTLGMILGAVWAKIAWGHYWTFDPKETWALISWIVYIIYLHLRMNHPLRHREAAFYLIFAFVFVLMCWFGVNYLPAAAGSMHIYTR